MKQRTYNIIQDGEVVLSITLSVEDGAAYYDIQWDSKTGLVTAKLQPTDEKRVPIPFVGKSVGKINPAPFSTENIQEIKYNYVYY